MQSGCSSGYNSMLGTAENPTTSTVSQMTQLTHPPPKLQILANGMTQMQISEASQPVPNVMTSSPPNQYQQQRMGNSSPLKRQNTNANAFESPRVQLELQQRRRLQEQRHFYGSDGMEITEAGPSHQQQGMQIGGVMSQQRTNQWMQDHYGASFQLDFKLFPNAQPSNSIISGMSGMSNMSQVTRFTNLSIDTRLSLQTNYDEIYGSCYNASISPLLSGFDAARENIDPNKFTETLESLLQRLLNVNEEPMNRMKALSSMLHRIKEMDVYSMDYQFKLQLIYIAIFLPNQISGLISDKQFEYVMQRSLSMIYNLLGIHEQIDLTASDGKAGDYGLIIQLYNCNLVKNLILFIKDCFKPERLQFQPLKNFGDGVEILVLLFNHLSHGPSYVKYAIKFIEIDLLIQLCNKSTKKSYLFECMRHILRSDALKDHFIRNLNGITWCLEQLRRDVAERNLRVVMSIMNQLIFKQPQIIQQIVNQNGLHTVAKFLSHGSPKLIQSVGHFLQIVGQQIRVLQFERIHIEEAVKNSLQMFGASDLKLISYLSGFLCNFTTQALPAKLANEYRGIQSIIHLLKILWYHERINIPMHKLNHIDIDECIDNLLFILSNMSSDRCDQSLCWDSSRQICAQSHALTMFLDILTDRSVQLYDHRVVLIVNRLLRNVTGLLKEFHTIFDSSTNSYNFVPTTMQIYEECFRNLMSKQPNECKIMLHRVLELMQLMCQNSVLKTSISTIIRSNPNYNIMDHLLQVGKRNIVDTLLKVLDLIHILIMNEPEMVRFWSNFPQLVQQNGFLQNFANDQQIISKFMTIEAEINKLSMFNGYSNNYIQFSPHENMYY